jgi:hypothetical protein
MPIASLVYGSNSTAAGAPVGVAVTSTAAVGSAVSVGWGGASVGLAVLAAVADGIAALTDVGIGVGVGAAVGVPPHATRLATSASNTSKLITFNFMTISSS